jgi:molybdenum cofactor cytidylyltransferase
MKNLGAIILAAGKGSRIGKPKLFLKTQDDYFINIIYLKLVSAGISEICGVIAPEIDVAQYLFYQQIKWTINPQPENEMISSIFYGVQFLKKCAGYLIVPVDHPAFKTSSVTILKNYFLNKQACVVKPAFKKQSGHPIIIPYEIAVKIKPQNYDGGLKQFLINSNCNIKYVEVNDSGILKNVNTKHDLENIDL